MVYRDDWDAPIGHLPLLYDPNDGPRTTPVDELRPLIAEVVEQHPRWGPSRIDAELRHNGHTVTIEQIRGFLAGL
jgi:hypothetical protein